MKRTKRVFAIIIGLTCLLVGSIAMAASINVTSDPGALGAEGGSVQLSISIANDSEYAMENISVSNNGTRFFKTSGVIIAPGETTAFSQSVSIPAAMLGLRNRAEQRSGLGGSCAERIRKGQFISSIPRRIDNTYLYHNQFGHHPCFRCVPHG